MKCLDAVVKIYFSDSISILSPQCHIHAGVPVVPFFGFGSSGGSLRNVDDAAARVDLSPPLPFGSATFTTAYVTM